MKDILTKIELLAEKARLDYPPQFDITQNVLALIQTAQIIKTYPLKLIAVTSAIAASVSFFIALNYLQYLNDPIMQFYTPLQEASLW